MTSLFRGARAAHLLVLAATLLIPCGAANHSTSSSTDDDTTPMAKLPPEVRLRKLHLVRPDLIQYPIQFEYYC